MKITFIPMINIINNKKSGQMGYGAGELDGRVRAVGSRAEAGKQFRRRGRGSSEVEEGSVRVKQNETEWG